MIPLIRVFTLSGLGGEDGACLLLCSCVCVCVLSLSLSSSCVLDADGISWSLASPPAAPVRIPWMCVLAAVVAQAFLVGFVLLLFFCLFACCVLFAFPFFFAIDCVRVWCGAPRSIDVEARRRVREAEKADAPGAAATVGPHP